jgi:hypothetical protein
MGVARLCCVRQYEAAQLNSTNAKVVVTTANKNKVERDVKTVFQLIAETYGVICQIAIALKALSVAFQQPEEATRRLLSIHRLQF